MKKDTKQIKTAFEILMQSFVAAGIAILETADAFENLGEALDAVTRMQEKPKPKKRWWQFWKWFSKEPKNDNKPILKPETRCH